jgi:hypothetical protein
MDKPNTDIMMKPDPSSFFEKFSLLSELKIWKKEEAAFLRQPPLTYD